MVFTLPYNIGVEEEIPEEKDLISFVVTAGPDDTGKVELSGVQRLGIARPKSVSGQSSHTSESNVLGFDVYMVGKGKVPFNANYYEKDPRPRRVEKT